MAAILRAYLDMPRRSVAYEGSMWPSHRANLPGGMVILFSRDYAETAADHVRRWTGQMGDASGLILFRLDDSPMPLDVRPLPIVDLHGQIGTRFSAIVRRAFTASPAGPSVDVRAPEAAGNPLADVDKSTTRPARNRAFIGRRELLQELARRIQSHRTIVLHGEFGMGKRAIAIEFAHRAADGYQRVVWLNGREPELCFDLLTRLAVLAGLCPPDSGTAQALRALGDRRSPERRLYIVENADPGIVRRLSPAVGRGHLVATSSADGWTRVATVIPVGPFHRRDSISYLRTSLPGTTEQDADALAARLRDEPSALAQAVSILRTSQSSVGEFAKVVPASNSGDHDGRPPDRIPRAAEDSTAAALDRLDESSPAAALFLRVCAEFAPQSVPLAWFGAAQADPSHAESVDDMLDADELSVLAAAIGRFKLARVDQESITLKVASRRTVRKRSDPEQQKRSRRRARDILLAVRPDDDGRTPKTWPLWRRLLPHLHEVSKASMDHGPLMRALDCALTAAIASGNGAKVMGTCTEVHTALLGIQLQDRETEHAAALTRAECLRSLADFETAYTLDCEVFEYRRKRDGLKNPAALEAARRVVLDLLGCGREEAAFELSATIHAIAQENFEASFVGPFADVLGQVRHARGEFHEARLLHEEAMLISITQHGREDPTTLWTQFHLALDCAHTNLDIAAQHMEDVLVARSRILGPDHPETAETEKQLKRIQRSLAEEEQRHRTAQLARPPRFDRPQGAVVIGSESLTIIALAESWFPKHGGIEAFNRQICRALAAKGHVVACIVADDPGQRERDDAKASGVRLVPAPSTPGRDQEHVTAALSQVETIRNLEGLSTPDVLFGHSRFTGMAAKLLMGSLGEGPTRRVHFIHMSPDESEPHKEGREQAPSPRAESFHNDELKLADHADLLVTIGPGLWKRYVRDFHRSGPPITHLTPGFDGTEAYGTVLPGHPSILFIGRAEDPLVKGLDLAARIVGAVASDGSYSAHRKLNFTVLGAEPEKQEGLKRDLRDLSAVDESVLDIAVRSYAADPDDVEHYFKSSTLLLMPSRAEGYGLAGHEGIARAIPTLVSQTSGLADLIHKHANAAYSGTVLPVTGDIEANVTAWSRRAREILDDTENAVTQARDLRQNLVQMFTWEKCADDLLNALRQSPPSAA